jgi:hypothetical protein
MTCDLSKVSTWLKKNYKIIDSGYLSWIYFYIFWKQRLLSQRDSIS